MSEKKNDGTLTTGEQLAKTDITPEKESYVKYRIERALKKKEPELFQKARAQLLDELGINDDDLDSLKELVKNKSADKSESEKLSVEMKRLQKIYEKELSEKKELLQKIEATQRENNQRKISDEIVKATTGKNVRNVQQVIRLLQDEFIVEDGKIRHRLGDDVDEKSVDDVVNDFLKTNEHFISASTPMGGAGSKPTNGEPKGVDAKQALLTVDGRRAAFEEFLRKGN